MVVVESNKVWWPEVFIIRAPMTIYAGWLSAATILNSSYMFKAFGMKNPSAPTNPIAFRFLEPIMFLGDLSEQLWSSVIAWVALVIYGVAAWSERNPLLGGVYLWAGAAILDDAI